MTDDDFTFDAWYFYASMTCEYFCHLDRNGKIPARFHGPYESKAEAVQAYREWKVEQMEPDAYEFAE